MSKPIARHFDTVLGVDIHMFIPPGAPPVPAPSPFVGMLYDPADFGSSSKATVFVKEIPRAIEGTVGIATTPHPPVPGPYAPMIPTHDCEYFKGSAKVFADGQPVGFLGQPVLSCDSIGTPPPVRKGKATVLTGLYKPNSVVVSVPSGVFVS